MVWGMFEIKVLVRVEIKIWSVVGIGVKVWGGIKVWSVVEIKVWSVVGIKVLVGVGIMVWGVVEIKVLDGVGIKVWGGVEIKAWVGIKVWGGAVDLIVNPVVTFDTTFSIPRGTVIIYGRGGDRKEKFYHPKKPLPNPFSYNIFPYPPNE